MNRSNALGLDITDHFEVFRKQFVQRMNIAKQQLYNGEPIGQVFNQMYLQVTADYCKAALFRKPDLKEEATIYSNPAITTTIVPKTEIVFDKELTKHDPQAESYLQFIPLNFDSSNQSLSEEPQSEQMTSKSKPKKKPTAVAIPLPLPKPQLSSFIHICTRQTRQQTRQANGQFGCMWPNCKMASSDRHNVIHHVASVHMKLTNNQLDYNSEAGKFVQELRNCQKQSSPQANKASSLICPECLKGPFKTQMSLSKHRQIFHLSTSQFRCKWNTCSCQYVSRSKSSALNHVTTKHILKIREYKKGDPAVKILAMKYVREEPFEE